MRIYIVSRSAPSEDTGVEVVQVFALRKALTKTKLARLRREAASLRPTHYIEEHRASRAQTGDAIAGWLYARSLAR